MNHKKAWQSWVHRYGKMCGKLGDLSSNSEYMAMLEYEREHADEPEENSEIKKEGETMKEYKVVFEQTVEGYIYIQAATKVEVKEVAQSLIDNSKIQHLIQEAEDVCCDDWKIKVVED